MRISVVIPTINRQKHLRRLLQSLKKQSLAPHEIIIVEQGDVEKTKELVASEQLEALVLFSPVPSAAQARNRGIEAATGEIIACIDDDFTLAPDYLETAALVFQTNPKLVALAGDFDTGKRMPVMLRLIAALFCLSSIRATTNIVLSSGHNLLRKPKEDVTSWSVEWLPGGNMLLRAEALDGLRFPEDFLHGSLGEDVYLTYQLFLRYGKGSLQMSRKLHLSHHTGTEGKGDPYTLIRMRIFYKYAFFRRVVYRRWWQLLCWGLSEVLQGIRFALHAPSRLRGFQETLRTYRALWRYRHDIKAANGKYNTFIFSSPDSR